MSKALKIAEQKSIIANLFIINIFCNSQTAINKLKSTGNWEY